MSEPAHVSNSAHCPICGWSSDTLHLRIHTVRCERWQHAVRELGVTVRPVQEVDQTIEQVRDDVRAANNDAEYLEATTRLVRNLYERSIGHAIKEGNWQDHPDYAAYAGMVDLDVLGEVWRDRVAHQSGHIAAGFTLWEPEGSRGRRAQFRAAERR